MAVSDPSSEVQDALGKIESFFSVSLGPLFDPVVCVVQGMIGSDNAKKISKSMTSIARALPKLAGNTSQILAGTLEIVTACGSLLGVGISIHRSIFVFVSIILNFAGLQGTPVDMTKVVSCVINDAFQKFQDEQMHREAFGLEKDFAVSQAFLQPYVKEVENGNVPTASDLSALAVNIPVSKGVVFLTILTRKIKQLQIEILAANTEEALLEKMEQILHYTELYCRLSTLRQRILLQILAIVSCSDVSKMFAGGIDSVITHAKTDDQEIVKHILASDNAIIASMFDPLRSQFVYKFIKSNNAGRILYVPEIVGKRVAMRPMKSMDCHLSLLVKANAFDFRDEKYLRIVDGPPTQSGGFYFIKKEHDIYHYLSPYGQKGKYLKAQADSWLVVQEGVPGPEGEWRVVLRNGNYLLSSRRWPARFLTVHNNGCLCIQFGIKDATIAEWLVEYMPRKYVTIIMEQNNQ